MAKFSSAAVLLILIATVSVYTCAFLGGAVLGRTLEREPTDIVRLSVSVRGVVKQFAQELGVGDNGGGRDVAVDGAARMDTADEARLSVISNTSSAEKAHLSVTNPSYGSAVVLPRPRPRHSNFSGEITHASSVRGVIKVGPWGGSGGQLFYLRGTSMPRLRSITLYHSDAIHAFTYEYYSNAGVSKSGPLGGRPYGSKGVHATMNLSADEHLVAVQGTFGHSASVPNVVVTSLTFRTDKGRTYGPYGRKAGTPFSIPAANGCIVGFWGRSGWMLDAIGVYIRPCATYEQAPGAGMQELAF